MLTMKWGPMLEVGSKINNFSTKKALAQVLENTAKEFSKAGLLTEAGLTQGQVVGASPV